MAEPQKQPPAIIVRRKKKGGGHGGHHGGSWKVAYADFVTAMMSFFLLLWLLNTTTSDQKQGLADYFAPASVSRSTGGAGGVMGGQTITSDGAQISDKSPPVGEERTIPAVGQGQEGEEDVAGKAEKGVEDGKGPGTGTAENSPLTEEQALAEAMKNEEDRFKGAETMLKNAIEGSPELKDLAQQIVIDRTPEGLRIQIVDKDKFSMFPSGGSTPYERGRDLLRLVGKVLSKLPNKISVTGHTDSTPFQPGSHRDNWTLSTERATVSLGALVYGGISDARVARVAGMADRDPLVPDNPKDPRNRRISIVLLRQTLPPADLQAASPNPAAPPPPSPEPPATQIAEPPSPASPQTPPIP